jgi:hypothetical protein
MGLALSIPRVAMLGHGLCPADAANPALIASVASDARALLLPHTDHRPSSGRASAPASAEQRVRDDRDQHDHGEDHGGVPTEPGAEAPVRRARVVGGAVDLGAAGSRPSLASAAWTWCSLLVQGRVSSAGSGLSGLSCCGMGGACARLVVRVVCARAPSLTSVRDLGWLRAGDMMCDGVIPLGEAVRPLGLSGPSTGWWRREHAGSRPRRIGVTKGCARTGKVMRVPAPPRRARAACGSCA